MSTFFTSGTDHFLCKQGFANGILLPDLLWKNGDGHFENGRSSPRRLIYQYWEMVL
ncbi:MAG: hypothetical protein H6654_05055 [Ardenticatenaceae bacterium]|nr:hypothetical protein [Anaerolineales bacterium]MCB8941794.1 hypothetical protein [Ardenticatenaceae bacterium]MCB8972906.1 hypothetical protein [Ardenticatenaceae bacterium]